MHDVNFSKTMNFVCFLELDYFLRYSSLEDTVYPFNVTASFVNVIPEIILSLVMPYRGGFRGGVEIIFTINFHHIWCC